MSHVALLYLANIEIGLNMLYFFCLFASSFFLFLFLKSNMLYFVGDLGLGL